MRKAVYAGSFDPITNGHLWMIEQGAGLFDELVVAVGVNPDKQYAFELQERLAMLREVAAPFNNVTIDSFENMFLVDYARGAGAGYILRGVRTAADYVYEQGMRHINSDMDAGIVAVFLMPPREYAELSSSLVKGLVGPGGWQRVVKQYVPATVFERFLKKYG